MRHRVTTTERPRIHLVASLGGHLELLEELARALEAYELVWVTSAGAKAEALARSGQAVRLVPRLDRSSLTPRTVGRIARLAWHERPRLVITSGAGLAVPFCAAARARGARAVFVETMARVTSGSATGRLLSRFSDEMVVQWPELTAVYPGATVCRPALLEQVAAVGGRDGTGTFVTFGSHDQPFERLMAATRRAVEEGRLPGPVFIQSGHTPVDPQDHGIESVPYMPPEAFRAKVSEAEVVITHGGAGAISTALRAGKRPIVMRRRAEYGEHVDDHQDEIVSKLAALGLIVPADHEIAADVVRRTGEAATTPSEILRYPAVAEHVAAIVERTLQGPS